jgi:hypothetical protein
LIGLPLGCEANEHEEEKEPETIEANVSLISEQSEGLENVRWKGDFAHKMAVISIMGALQHRNAMDVLFEGGGEAWCVTSA